MRASLSTAPAGVPAGAGRREDRRVSEASSTLAADRAGDTAAAAVPASVKPKLRGWLHAGTFPLAVVAGIALVALAPSQRARISIAVFTVTAGLLFGISALYHRFTWSTRTHAVLRRFDHSNIFLLIAGTYTPLAAILLDRPGATLLLGLVWGGAVLGVGFRVAWIDAPRWLYVPVYVAMGWSAAFWLPAFGHTGGAAVVTLVVVGGAFYVLGALAYGFRRPDPAPTWFGFHEVFHGCTVLGLAAHFTAIALAAWAVRA